MEQATPPAVRVALRCLTLLAFLLSVAWCVRSFGYESAVALVTTSYGVLLGFSVGKSNMYEVLFGFLRVVAYAGYGMIAGAFLFGVPVLYLDLELPWYLLLAGIGAFMLLGLLLGIRASLKKASTGPAGLAIETSTAFFLKILPLCLVLVLAREVETVLEFVAFILIGAIGSAASTVCIFDLKTLGSKTPNTGHQADG